MRELVFKVFHNASHPGVSASVKLLTQHVVWPSIKRDVKRMTQSCINCQKAKVSRHTHSAPGKYNLVSQRFTNIHLDIIGPLKLSENFNYCVTIIDRFTRWPEAIPISDIKASTVASAVYSGWIARFGVPEIIVTDCGSQFESQLFDELSKLIGFQRKHTTSYNPKCNGFIERWHRTLKSALMCHERDDWSCILPTVLLGLRTVFRDEFNSSAAELVYGSTIRVPGQFLDNNERIIYQSEFVSMLKNHFNEIRPSPATSHCSPSIFVFKNLKDCSHVFLRTDSVRRSLQTPYEGPFLVISRDEKTFLIEIRGKHVKVSIDRLKPCYNEFDNTISNDTYNFKETNYQSKNASKKEVRFNLPDEPAIKKVTTRVGRSTTIPRRLLD